MDFKKIKELYDTKKQQLLNEIKKEIKEEYVKQCDLLIENQDKILSKPYVISFNLMNTSRYISIDSSDIKNILHEEYNIPIENIECKRYTTLSDKELTIPWNQMNKSEYQLYNDCFYWEINISI